jgi:hypothetical protein
MRRLLLHLAIMIGFAQAHSEASLYWEMRFGEWRAAHPAANSGCDANQWAAIANGSAGAPSCDGRLVRMI